MSGQKWGVAVNVWWLQVIGVGGVRTEMGCYSYCVVLQVIDVGGVRTEMWLLQLLCGGYRSVMWMVSRRNWVVTVIMWWLQVSYVDGVRTEMGVLQLLCGSYR